MGLEPIYDASFYDTHEALISSSAAAVVPLVMDLVAPASVVDLGCGRGLWLAEFRRHGVERSLGLDGSHLDPNRLEIPPGSFMQVDLEQPLAIPGRFDLAVCLEVVEHLTETAGRAAVDALAAAAPIVLFSAAVPLQGGSHHINEQWPGYWMSLFAAHGFRAIDFIRPHIRDNPRVAWWYRQNLIMFASEDALAARPRLAGLGANLHAEGIEWVHIKVHRTELSDYATLLRAPGALRRKLDRVARRWFRRLTFRNGS